MSRKRRKFTDEFKLEAVKLVKEGPRSVGEIARELDLTESALRNWVNQYEVDNGTCEGLSTEEHEELRRLRHENRQLKMEREVLKNPRRPAALPTEEETRELRYTGGSEGSGRTLFGGLPR